MLSHEENISNAPVEFQSSRCYRRVPACVAGDPATFNISDDARRVCVWRGGGGDMGEKNKKKKQAQNDAMHRRESKPQPNEANSRSGRNRRNRRSLASR